MMLGPFAAPVGQTADNTRFVCFNQIFRCDLNVLS